MPRRRRSETISVSFGRSEETTTDNSTAPSAERKDGRGLAAQFSGVEGAESVRLEDDGTETIVARGARDGEVKVNRNELRHRLVRLFALRDTPVAALAAADQEVFESVVEIAARLAETEYYPSFLAEVRAMGDRVRGLAGAKPLAPATVGAFLEGCLLASNFDGPKGCSPHCVGQLAGPDAEPCSALVLFKDKAGAIFRLNEEASDRAYLYFEDPAAELTPAEVDRLAAAGVKLVSILRGVDAQGNYGSQTEFVDVATLANKPPPPPVNTVNPAWIFVGLALVLLVVLIIVAASARRW